MFQACATGLVKVMFDPALSYTTDPPTLPEVML